MQSGNSRLAWRASNVDVATVQPIVAAIVPAAVTVNQRIGRTAAEPVASASRSTTRIAADAAQRRAEQTRLARPAERGSERDRDHQRDRAQHDVEVRERIFRQAAEDERVHADLAQRAARLDRGEDGGDERKHPPLRLPDPGSAASRATPPIHSSDA